MQQNHNILIFGSGQIASALLRQLVDSAQQITRAECDFLTATKADFTKFLEQYQPKAIINAAAFTAVDKAEGEGRDAAFRINGEAIAMLAQAAAALDVPLVHYSTDYVFDGSGDAAWRESDAPNPINTYGASKLAGEKAIQQAGGKHLIFRISWVYDEMGKNFLNTMLKLGREREALTVVSDQFGAPCYAADITDSTIAALTQSLEKQTFPSGIYHMCNAGETNWHAFAECIFKQASSVGADLKVQNITAIKTSEYPTPAKRPLNSRLNCEKLQATFNIALPDWGDALQRCIRNKYAS